MRFDKVVLMSNDERQSSAVCRMLDRIGIRHISAFHEATPFLTYLTANPDALVLLMQEGPLGVELAWNVRERMPDSRILWFSDLDFALTAFRFKVSWFGLLPVTEETLGAALAQAESRYFPT